MPALGQKMRPPSHRTSVRQAPARVPHVCKGGGLYHSVSVSVSHEGGGGGGALGVSSGGERPELNNLNGNHQRDEKRRNRKIK
jgi:hypothetical protein